MPEYNDHNAGIVARTTTLDMSPAKWHYRLPFFGKEVGLSDLLACTVDTQCIYTFPTGRSSLVWKFFLCFFAVPWCAVLV